MADKDVITYLIKLQDETSKKLEEVSKQAKNTEKKFEALRKTQNSQKKASEKQAKAIDSLKSSFKVVAAAAVAAGTAFAAMGLGAIKTSANLEKFETQLATLLGSVDAGRERVEKLFAISASTPFEIGGLVEMDTKLEAFGVNADEVRQGVMDLAAVTGMDLVTAADAVGRALAGGAGAADMLRDKGVKGWVEVQAGISAADMTLDEWRENLVNTLKTNEKIVGGTQDLAKTFVGLFSSMKDQWTIFQKQVGDAGAFNASKAMLSDILDLIGQNKEMTSRWAVGMSQGVVQVLVLILSSVGRIAETYNFFEKSTLAWGNGVDALIIKLEKLYQSYLQVVGTAKQLTGTFREGEGAEIDRKMLQSFKDAGKARERIRVSLEERLPILEQEGNKLRDIRRVAEDISNRFAAGEFESGSVSGQTGAAASQAIMTGPTLEAGAGAGDAAKVASEFFKEIESSTKAAEAAVSQLTDALKGPQSESEKLAADLGQTQAAMGVMALKATQLGVDVGGPKMQNYFGALREQIDQTSAAYKAALDKEVLATVDTVRAIEEKIAAEQQAAKESRKQRIGEAVSMGVDIASSGGLGALSAAGPYGAAAAGLIGMGQEGQAAVDQKVDEDAQKIADKRRQEMEAQAKSMTAQGFSADEIAAAGLGKEAIAEAGVVTKADKMAARQDIDQSQVMADNIAQGVKGVIAGIKAIAKGLPAILQELIPLFLVELPAVTMKMIPKLIESLIPVIIEQLPKVLLETVFKTLPRMIKLLVFELVPAIALGVGRGVVNAWKMIKKFFKDLFKMGFQTGGFVPKTGMALLHQGERVVPATGVGTQTATRGLAAFGGGAGPNLTVNTNVVSPDAIPELGRLLDRELGAYGRMSFPIFSDASAVTSI